VSTPDSISLDALRKTAIEAARAAGAVLLENFEKTLRVDTAYQHDLKLEVDRLADAAVCKVLRSAFPKHAIMTEESGEAAGSEPYQWIIDPLDGTVNYFGTLPYFCTSIACYRIPSEPRQQSTKEIDSIGEPLVGVIHAPAMNEMYVAVAGAGVTANDVPIRAHPGTRISDAIVCTTMGGMDRTKARMIRVNSAILKHCRKLRCFGASALDLAYLARGRFSALYHPEIKTWDIAAGLLMLQESGVPFALKPLQALTWDLTAGAPGIYDGFSAVIAKV